MEKITLGILREGKQPPDRRVPFTPDNCKELMGGFPHLEIIVQPSEIRGFTDDEYKEAGIAVQEDMGACDVLMGVKEVQVGDLIEGKKYFFFSHTIKEQEYNRELLQTILEKNIQLIDYECLTYANGFRIIGFGRYAGIVGAYNALIGYGKRMGLFDLKPAHQCKDKAELDEHLKRLDLPNIKIVLTGEGRVGGGAKETLDALGVKQVTPEEYLLMVFDQPVYCQLGVRDYNKRKDGSQQEEKDFFDNPKEYETAFLPYTQASDIFISCHFWDPKAPKLFSREDIRYPSFRMKVIADISCDIDGSVPTTLEASTIEEPFYGYNPVTEQKDGAFGERTITIMAIDNLPCELPRNSSEGFGSDLINNVLPYLLGDDPDRIIERASITKNGSLTEEYKYLDSYASK